MMTIAFMTHNMGKLNLKSFSEIVNSCLFTFFIHYLFTYILGILTMAKHIPNLIMAVNMV